MVQLFFEKKKASPTTRVRMLAFDVNQSPVCDVASYLVRLAHRYVKYVRRHAFYRRHMGEGRDLF